jgi:hypothetical protein
MPNTTKLYQDGSDLLLTTNRGNYSVKSDGIYKTTRTGEGLTEVPFDITAQAAFENAVAASEYRVSYDACVALLPLVDEKMEDYD